MENINVDQRNGNIQSLFGSQLPLCKGELEGNLDRDDFPSLWLQLLSLFLESRFEFYYFPGIKVSSFFRVDVITYSRPSLLGIERTEPHERDPFPGLYGLGNEVDRGL